MASFRGASEDPTKFELLRDALYQAVVDNGSESRLWNQKELLDLDVIPEQNLVVLMKAVQALCQDFLFKAMNDSRAGLCWRYRPAVDAAKYKQLNQDQIMVYELIDDAGADGIWARSLKHRLNMHDSVLKQCIKHLEVKGYIRDMKSVENIGKKMYIKATLRPSERATGGPWYTDDTFDEAFIDQLQRVVFDLIRDRSSYLSRHGGAISRGGAAGATARQPKKGAIRGGDLAAAGAGASSSSSPAATAKTAAPRGTKRGAEALSTGDDGRPVAHANGQGHIQQRRSRRHQEVLLPMPMGYTEYPTVRHIAELIDQSGITSNTTLGESDVQQIVDVLVYDGLLESVRLPHSHDTGYRALNRSRLAPGSSLQAEENGVPVPLAPGQPQPTLGAPTIRNGFTESPCGLCPVFDLCEDGGPVSPANCEYFNRWLGLEDLQTTAPPMTRDAVGADEIYV
ncbi:DNA-directed RNA polymerase 3 subunit [Grosmannia clavigera kw1407]|uniref:DNA-directed RNA polymerase 3 subunit n=1 Tax=Grosmannia clavigera (strain kw1407 / UAMH 11150) TaxID=655863 RepID=F0XCW0_GROCL|nr:DNA-directed RNA polymerase 3 subunit [Grosmannia clavigera kw1407]EFX04040.1 DNA-directed RNA polymerase 3 subunit [Grosmannia clavigera kw1407]